MRVLLYIAYIYIIIASKRAKFGNSRHYGDYDRVDGAEKCELCFERRSDTVRFWKGK